MNAPLIDVETGGHLRAERFETDRRNLAEAENEIPGCVNWTFTRKRMAPLRPALIRTYGM